MSDLEKNLQTLTGLIQDLATGLDAIKERQEQQEASIAAYKEAVRRGFPIPSVNASVPADVYPADMKEYLEPYNLAIQGKRLTDKLIHPVVQMSEEARAKLTEYFILFVKAGIMGDHKAYAKFRDAYGAVGKSTVTVGDLGNVFPVPDVLMTEILSFAREKSVALRYARQWNMTSEKQSFPAETPGSAAVYWGNETEEATPVIGEVELEAEELSAYAGVKNTTLADAQTDITSWLAEVMAEAAGLELDNQTFNGAGTICYGILSSQCGNSVYLGGGSTSGKTAFSDLDYSDLSVMIAKLPGLRKMGARFWLSGDVLHYVRIMKDDANRPVFIEPVGLEVPGKIFGYPYEEVIKMPVTSAVSTPFIAFGNLQYFAIGRRLNSAALQVNPYDQWKTNRTLFKIYQRWGLKMALSDGFVRLITAAS
jgi:HK97 family phage major capsid protein